eukprot:TRINITY_DN21036_c0_g1_i1.p1 TRINITY_DN21036_c0_g1~~TRINITY_DN21036_c0_g1_i1.p1  ORF type:complete len:176 (+),score=43.17 TRINITY_DN21036_c0_g1_i1:80-529(+)
MMYFSTTEAGAFDIYYGSIMRMMTYGFGSLLFPFPYAVASALLVTVAYAIVMVLRGQLAVTIVLVAVWGSLLSRTYDGTLKLKFILEKRPGLIMSFMKDLLATPDHALTSKELRKLKAALASWNSPSLLADTTNAENDDEGVMDIFTRE